MTKEELITALSEFLQDDQCEEPRDANNIATRFAEKMEELGHLEVAE